MAVRLGQVELGTANAAEPEPAANAPGGNFAPRFQLVSAKATITQELRELLSGALLRFFSLNSISFFADCSKVCFKPPSKPVSTLFVFSFDTRLDEVLGIKTLTELSKVLGQLVVTAVHAQSHRTSDERAGSYAAVLLQQAAQRRPVVV